MQSINSWNTLFQGKYSDKELSILYVDDTFVSILKSRDQLKALVNVYKVFNIIGDSEVFTLTLPYPAILYQKHLDIGEKNTYKYLLLDSSTEYVDTNTLSYHIDMKIKELNKRVGSIISIVKSYDLKLISLKLASEEVRNFFFSDPIVSKLITNAPQFIDFSGVSQIDKLILGIKNNVHITTSLDRINSVSVFNASLDERLFSIKVICENYLLSSKTVVIFDSTNTFRSLSYPQQKEELLKKYNLKAGAFGFPVELKKYFDIKIPLSDIPKSAFINIFKFYKVGAKIIEVAYSDNLENIEELIEQVKNIKITENITDFEKHRVISKLIILKEQYKDRFGTSEISSLFENKYKHIGSIKLLNVDNSDSLYIYYINSIFSSILKYLNNDILFVFPESKDLFNNIFLGDNIIRSLKENPNTSYILSSQSKTDFRIKDLSEVEIDIIRNNDVVIRFPNRDPLRLLLRPTITSSNIEIKDPN